MIFGAPSDFAIEAALEPGPDLPNIVGSNVAGRMRLFIGGRAVGNFDEPACVLRAVSEHLVTFSAAAHSLWHPTLNGLQPMGQFSVLNEALFLGCDEEPPEEYARCGFLTNISEAFDGVKGFLLFPGNGLFVTLIEQGQVFSHHTIPYTGFCTVAARFALWVREQELALLGKSAA
jgi:hypothetical protein